MEESSRGKAKLCDGKLVEAAFDKGTSEGLKGQMCSDVCGMYSKERRYVMQGPGGHSLGVIKSESKPV